MDTQSAVEPSELDEAESLARLRSAAVGRLGVIVDGRPDIFPVNFVVDRGAVVFRTAEGTKLAACVGHHVAFEADSMDDATDDAWSVVLKGTAREIVQLHDVLDALDLPISPWHAGSKPRIVRIDRDSITGRQFHAASRAPAASAIRRAADE